MLILANHLDGGLDGSLSPHSTICPSTYVRRVPSINVLIIYSLTVRFDTLFHNIFGDHFLPVATIPKDSILGIAFCLFALSPRFPSTGQTSQSRSILGGEF